MDKERSISEFILDIFLPNRCAFCQRVIDWDTLVCDKCREELPLAQDTDRKLTTVDGCYSALYYRDQVVSLIHRLKDTGEVNNFAELCARITSEKIKAHGLDTQIQLITSVPMDPGKKRRRGYNQAERFAKYLSKFLDKPTDHHLLVRSSDKTEQHKLSASDRAEHARLIYSLPDPVPDIKGMTILLCDDVLTTGSTVSVCAQLLREAGAEAVYCCTCAATEKHKHPQKKKAEDDAPAF